MARRVAKKAQNTRKPRPDCKACGGSGKNSRGGDCVCVTGPRKRSQEPAETKPKRRRRSAKPKPDEAPTAKPEPPKQPKPKPKRKRGKRGKATRVYQVEAVRVDARRLVSIEPHDPIWQRDESAPPVHAYPENKDAIVRLKPPADATDKLIADIERACRNDGAMAVKVLPRENAAAVVVQGKRRREREEKMTHRQRVAKMVADANSQRHRSLAALCTEVMDEEGL